MLFPTVAFAIFFVVAYIANWSMPARGDAWRLTMLGLSLLFYAWWDPYGSGTQWWWRPFVLLLIGSICWNYVFAALVARALRAGSSTKLSRRLVFVGVSGNLGLLGYFKYYAFFTTSLSNSLEKFGIGADLPLLNVILPVGISFYTFQAISYVVDVGRGRSPAMRILDLGVYLTFFPQLVAGPIVRVTEFAPQMNEPADSQTVSSSEALGLIFSGLFKKVVVSSYLASNIVDPVFSQPGRHSALEVVLAVYGYAVQIYADFSGYTDIAIGCALLLGFRFPQNFDSPYRAVTLQDFWRRWHMTLSRWLRDYLYIPLGGSRQSRLFTYRNLMLTMLIGGLWHGAAWNFIIWGGIHGVVLAWERWNGERSRSEFHLPSWLRWLVTFHVVCLGWVFFRAETFADALMVISRLIHFGPAPLATASLVAVIATALLVQFIPAGWDKSIQLHFSKLPWLIQGSLFGFGLMLVSAFGPVGIAPFIYFQF